MNVLKIDSVPMPQPAAGGYSVTRSDLDSQNTGRSEDGRLLRERIRDGVYKIEATWRVSAAKLSELTSALAPEEVSVEFYDLTTSAFVTRTMYVSDRKAALLGPMDESTPSGAFCEYTCSLVEY